MAVAGSVVGFAVYEVGRIHRVAVPNLAKVPSSGIENIRLVGSTDRCAVTSNSKNLKAFENECQTGVNGVNSDVVMILYLDPVTHKVPLLSIPRDTFIPDARADGRLYCNNAGGCADKIDAAL